MLKLAQKQALSNWINYKDLRRANPNADKLSQLRY